VEAVPYLGQAAPSLLEAVPGGPDAATVAMVIADVGGLADVVDVVEVVGVVALRWRRRGGVERPLKGGVVGGGGRGGVEGPLEGGV